MVSLLYLRALWRQVRATLSLIHISVYSIAVLPLIAQCVDKSSFAGFIAMHCELTGFYPCVVQYLTRGLRDFNTKSKQVSIVYVLLF